MGTENSYAYGCCLPQQTIFSLKIKQRGNIRCAVHQGGLVVFLENQLGTLYGKSLLLKSLGLHKLAPFHAMLNCYTYQLYTLPSSAETGTKFIV